MRRWVPTSVAFGFAFSLSACSFTIPTPPTPAFEMQNCSQESPKALNEYDKLSATYLNEVTRHPPNNSGGAVVWGSRYYLESLVTAYEATGNPKYTRAFLDSGGWVMNLSQTIPILDAPDPTAPGAEGATINVTGWPTLLGSYGTPVPVPTGDGKISLYAQSLEPNGGPDTFQVTKQGDGTLQLAWLGSDDQVLQTNTVATLSDAQALAVQPLIWGQSLARIFPTGNGVPVPGQYKVGTQEQTVWHEQTGGILLPIAQFLLLAKDHPEIVDSSVRSEWTSKVLSIASSYEDEFVSDGAGGLRFVNPQWLPNAVAGTDMAADYIFVEANLRLVLYELTGDPHQLSIATRLVLHQRNFNWQVNSSGWLELKYWPDFIPWSNRADAPVGSIWDVFQYDPTTPAPSSDASFVADLFKSARTSGLASKLGITPYFYEVQQATFLEYMVGSPNFTFFGPKGIMRPIFPRSSSTLLDAVTYSLDPFAPSAWADPVLSDSTFTNVNWNWMLQYGQTDNQGDVGYFLRAWARSEAAELKACQASHSVPTNP
jgi:hypothetical protein